MPRARERLTLESGPVLDLGKIIPKGAAKPGVHRKKTTNRLLARCPSAFFASGYIQAATLTEPRHLAT